MNIVPTRGLAANCEPPFLQFINDPKGQEEGTHLSTRSLAHIFCTIISLTSTFGALFLFLSPLLNGVISPKQNLQKKIDLHLLNTVPFLVNHIAQQRKAAPINNNKLCLWLSGLELPLNNSFSVLRWWDPKYDMYYTHNIM
jgi:hypothetical protein